MTGLIVGEWKGLETTRGANRIDWPAGARINAAAALQSNLDLRLEHELQTVM